MTCSGVDHATIDLDPPSEPLCHPRSPRHEPGKREGVRFACGHQTARTRGFVAQRPTPTRRRHELTTYRLEGTSTARGDSTGKKGSGELERTSKTRVRNVEGNPRVHLRVRHGRGAPEHSPRGVHYLPC